MSVTRLYHDTDQARRLCELIMDGKHAYELLIQRLGDRRNAFVRTPAEVVEILESIRPESYNVIWIRPNPLNRDPAPLADAQRSELKLPNSSATGDDVARWCFVQVDFDAVKADGNKYASSDTEHLDALKARDRYHSHALTMYDIEPAYIGDTGNGGVLLYRVDLPNTPQNIKLIKDAFRAIAESAGVKIDTATLDVVRFMGLPGTINRGKEAAEDRPHRLRTGDVYPDTPIVSAAILEALQTEYRPLQSPESNSQESTDGSELADSERQELISIVSEGWTDGNRHNYGLAVSGLLFHMGVSVDQAKSIIEEISTKAGDTDTADRLEACERTYERGNAGETVAWHETLEETLPQSQMQAIGKLRAGIRDRGGDDDPGWQEPVPLQQTHGPQVNPETLPDYLRQYCEARAASLQVPLDMVVTNALGLISTAVTGQYVVDYHYSEPAHGMFVNVARPGERKSPLMKAMAGAIYRWQKEKQERDRLLIAEWESMQRTLEKQRDSLEREPRKGEQSGESRDLQRRAAVQELHDHEMKKPVLTTVIIDDATPQAVAWLMVEQPGVAVVSAESAYLENFYRYSDSPDYNAFLSGHAAEPISIHRRSGKSATTERACLSLCMSIQPDSLERMGGVQGFMERGGTARLLTSIPKGIAGTRLTGRNVPKMPESLSQWWDALLIHLLETRETADSESHLSLSPDAFLAAEEFEDEVEGRYSTLDDNDPMRGWMSKQLGAALRIAGLLHLISNDPSTPISAETMQSAIALSEWYREHAFVAFSMMADTTDDHARTVWNTIKAWNEPTVSRRDLFNKIRGRAAFKRAADLDGPLSILEDAGYIRLRKVTTKEGGRPAEWIDVNPLASIETHTQYPQNPIVRPFEVTAKPDESEYADLQPTGTDGDRWEAL